MTGSAGDDSGLGGGGGGGHMRWVHPEGMGDAVASAVAEKEVASVERPVQRGAITEELNALDMAEGVDGIVNQTVRDGGVLAHIAAKDFVQVKATCRVMSGGGDERHTMVRASRNLGYGGHLRQARRMLGT